MKDIYYECINGDGHWFTEGNLYKILDPNNIEAECNFIDNKGRPNGWSGSNCQHFRLSNQTKQLSEQPEPIKEDFSYLINLLKKITK